MVLKFMYYGISGFFRYSLKNPMVFCKCFMYRGTFLLRLCDSNIETTQVKFKSLESLSIIVLSVCSYLVKLYFQIPSDSLMLSSWYWTVF